MKPIFVKVPNKPDYINLHYIASFSFDGKELAVVMKDSDDLYFTGVTAEEFKRAVDSALAMQGSLG